MHGFTISAGQPFKCYDFDILKQKKSHHKTTQPLFLNISYLLLNFVSLPGVSSTFQRQKNKKISRRFAICANFLAFLPYANGLRFFLKECLWFRADKNSPR